MAGQDYDKDLYLVLVGSETSTLKNFVDNVEDYIFGPRDEREATLLVPYTPDLSPSLSKILNEWAIGQEKNDDGELVLLDEPNYPVFAYVETGHKSVAKAKKVMHIDKPGVAMPSGAIEAAMSDLVKRQKEGNEVAVVVLYDEEKDVQLVGALKNYNSIPVLNLDGMIDSFPGFKTTDEILKEEREREEFETKEAIRIAAEKEQEKAQKEADSALKTPRKAAAPRKRAAKAPEEKPLTEKTPVKKAAAPRKAATPKAEVPAEPVEGTVEKPTELPKELEPVKPKGQNPDQHPWSAIGNPHVGEDVWNEVAKAQAAVSFPADKLVVSKESLAQLGEGIKEMSEAYSKTISALTDMIREK